MCLPPATELPPAAVQELRRRGDVVQAVAGGHRGERNERTVGLQQRGDAVGDEGVEGEGAAEQRAPRELDGDLVEAILELGRQRLGCGRDEDRVREAAASWGTSGTARDLPHRAGICVDPDDERARLASSPTQDGQAVTGAEVRDGAIEAGPRGSHSFGGHTLGAAALEQLVESRLDDPSTYDDPHGVSPPVRLQSSREMVGGLADAPSARNYPRTATDTILRKPTRWP